VRNIAIAGLLLGAVSFSAHAQQVVPSTPDISIGATSTLDVGIPGGRANWVHLQNQCADTAIYFDLRGARDRAANIFPLRLPAATSPDSSFQANFTLAGSIEASASSGASGTCTFTVLFGR